MSRRRYVEVDLDKEVVRDKRGRRITSQRAKEIAEEVLEAAGRRPGRPSLTGGSQHSPLLSTRIPKDLDAAVVERAAARGLTKSQAVREALERWVEAS